MEQKMSLEDLVERVDHEARKYASFDEFLNASEKLEEKCKESVGVVEDSSLSGQNTKVGAPEGSSKPSSAAPATVQVSVIPAHEPIKQAMSNPAYIANGLRAEQLSHPMAPEVLPEEEPTPGIRMATTVVTTYDVKDMKWPDGPNNEPQKYFVEVTEAKERNPESWKARYNEGRAYAEEPSFNDCLKRLADLDEVKAQITSFQQGLKSKLAERLHKAPKKDQEKAEQFEKDYRDRANKKVAEKMKADRAPKAGIGIKKATVLMSSGLVPKAMIIEAVRNDGLMDDATMAFIEKGFSK